MKMKSGKFLAICLAMFIVVHAPTSAQAETDRQISEGVLKEYVACIIGHTSRRALDRFLRIDPNSAEANQAGTRLLSDLLQDDQIKCFPKVAMQFQVGVARGAIYEILYRDYVAREGKSLPREMPIKDHPRELTVLGTDGGQAFFNIRAYGDCVVRAGPAEAQRLILSDVGTSGEAASFDGMRDTLGACLATGSVRFSREALRGIVAEALYKFTV